MSRISNAMNNYSMGIELVLTRLIDLNMAITSDGYTGNAVVDVRTLTPSILSGLPEEFLEELPPQLAEHVRQAREIALEKNKGSDR